MDIHAIAISLVFFPFAIVHIAVCVPELAFPIGFVKFPSAFILGTVWPYLDAWAVSHAFSEISYKDSTMKVANLCKLLHFRTQAPQ